MEVGTFLGGVLVARVHSDAGALSDAEADQRRRSRRNLVDQIAGRFHGQSRHTSDGSVLAVFDSVNAAATAAVTLQRQFPTDLGRLSCAVGGGEISSGQEGGFAGTPVDSALDLISQCQPGEVMLCPLAKALAGTRLTFPVNLSTAATQYIQWQPQDTLANELQLPASLAVHDAQPFVGRKAQLQSLMEQLNQVRQGATRWASVVAPAGLGKTRLLAELAAHAKHQGVVVVGGAADEDLTRAFAPVAQGLEHVVNNATDLATRLGPGAADLVRIVPKIRECLLDLPQPVRGDSHTERQALFSAVAGWLCALAAEAPLLVMLDSLHWEGESTYDLLVHLLDRIKGYRILLVTSQRDNENRTERLLKAARNALGSEAVAEIHLAGLAEQEICEFLGQGMADQPPSPEMLRSLMDITAGSPLHLREIRRQPIGDSVASGQLNLAEAVRARVSALAKPLRRLIEVASVVGEVFELKEIVAVFDDPDDPFEALDGAVEEGLVDLIDSLRLSYRFVHSLTRETVYAGIGAARRARLHQRAGAAIEAQGQVDSRLNDLARHYARAASLGFETTAIDYCLRAGNQALDQFANEMALGQFEQGLALLPPAGGSAVEIDLLTGVGRAQRRLGTPEYRSALFKAADLALSLGDGPRMAIAVYAAYRGSYTRALHVDKNAVSHLRQALQLLADDQPGHRARLLALLAIELTWSEDRQKALEVSEQAIDVATREAPELVLQVLTHSLWVRFYPLSRRLAVADQIASLRNADTDPRLAFEIASHDIFTATRLGDRQRLDSAHQLAKDLSHSIGQPSERSMLLLRQTTLALMEGRYQDMQSCMSERRQLARQIGEADGEAAFRIHQFWLAYDQAPAQQCGQMVAMAGATLDPRQRFFAWPNLLMPACDTGHEALAQQIVTTLAEEGFEEIPRDQMWLWNIAQLAYAVARLNLSQHAQALLRLLQPKRGYQANMVFNTLGSVARYSGMLKSMLGDIEGARAELLHAIADNQQLGAVTWKARCQLDLAALELANGGCPTALFNEVEQTAQQLEMPLLGSALQNLRS